jgi:hypothetical protein
MKCEEFVDELLKNYPRVYPSYPYCGIYVPEEWEYLIRELSKELEDYLKTARMKMTFKTVQVKEKFGELRFYFECSEDHSNEQIMKIVSKYEAMSTTINRKNTNE